MTVSSGVELGTLLGGTYRIVRLIGSGGMGQVYEATHERLAVRYAVKIVRADVRDQPEALARFMREAQVMSRLRHPGIVAIVDFNTLPNGSAFLVMEYLEGESLGKVLARTGPMPLERVADLTEQMSSALSAAHAQGIVHRDIHPQNVFLLPPSSGHGGERIKILDFGISATRGAEAGPPPEPIAGGFGNPSRVPISKIASVPHRITGAAAVMGTPLYMSPEQAEGKMNELDAASDQFSLAAMVYEMLTGKPAFSGDTLASIAYQVVHATPVPARTHRPSLPAEVENVVSRALAKNKRDRFSSVAEFAVHLRWTVSLAANRTPAPQLPGPGTDGEPTLVVNSPDDPTPVSTLPSGMAAVLRETIGGGSSTGATVSAAPRRWRVVLVSAIFGGALALAAGLLTRPRARERMHATPAPASAPAAPPTRTLASTSESVPTTSAVAAHAAPSADNEGSPARMGGPTRGRARPTAKRVGDPARAEIEETTEPVARPTARCLLTVGTYPWSELWVDGADTGQHTPVVGLPLECGAHKLELKRADLNVDQVENVTLEEGRENKRHFDLPVEGVDN